MELRHPRFNFSPGHEFVDDPEVVRQIVNEALEEFEYVTPKEERRRIVADVIEELDLDAPGRVSQNDEGSRSAT